MDSGYYAAITGLVARTQALDTAAANLANAQTPGYRAEREFFRSVLLGPDGAEITIDLQSRTLTLQRSDLTVTEFRFDFPEAQHNRLLNGLDAIAETLLHEAEIRSHELHSPSCITPAATTCRNPSTPGGTP